MNDMPPLPKVIKVACFDIEVLQWTEREANSARRFGEFSGNEQCIRIDQTLGRWKMLDTLLHETFHAIYWAYSIDDGDKEERIVNAMSTAMAQVLRDNPDLVRFISETTNGH